MKVAVTSCCICCILAGGLFTFAHAEQSYSADEYAFVKLFQRAQENDAWTSASLRNRLLLIREEAAKHSISSNPVSSRYLITCYGGPIDLVHFLMLAAEVAGGKESGPRLYLEWQREGGPENVFGYNHRSPPAAHPDDLPSNAFGALWGQELREAFRKNDQLDLLTEFCAFMTPLKPVPDKIAQTFSHAEIVMGYPDGRFDIRLSERQTAWFTASPLVQTDLINRAARQQFGYNLCKTVNTGQEALNHAGFRVMTYKNTELLIIRAR